MALFGEGWRHLAVSVADVEHARPGQVAEKVAGDLPLDPEHPFPDRRFETLRVVSGCGFDVGVFEGLCHS